MQTYYSPSEYNYLDSFSHIDDPEILQQKIDEILVSPDFFPAEASYFLAKNKNLILRDDYIDMMKSVFYKFKEENILEESLYNFFDGWTDYFSKLETNLEISILGEKIKRTLIDERTVEKVKDMLYEVLPMLGETELLHYYKVQLSEDFSITEY